MPKSMGYLLINLFCLCPVLFTSPILYQVIHRSFSSVGCIHLLLRQVAYGRFPMDKVEIGYLYKRKFIFC